MNIKKYILHFLNNFIFTFLISLIYSYSNNQSFVDKNIIYIFLFILIFTIFSFLIKPINNIRNLDQKIRRYFITFIYTISIIYLSTLIFNYHIHVSASIFIYLFLLLVLLLSSNIYISRALMIDLDIFIVGASYKFTNNDYQILKELKINYYLCDSIEDYLKINNTIQKKIIINNSLITNTAFKKMININHEFDKTYEIYYFLNKFIRKIDLHDKTIKNITKYNKMILTLKLIIDLSVIIFFIPILLVALPISFLLVKYQSRGNFIFKQNRVGKNGKLFQIYKIRSMHNYDEASSFLRESDQERIFNFGKFLRKSRLDELPQFLNVLRGDMHIAGPRAEWDYLQKLYIKNIDNYELRNVVSPGITGFAQVMFRYAHNEEDSREKFMFDLYYIKNWTIWLEIEIGIKTVQIMINKEGF